MWLEAKPVWQGGAWLCVCARVCASVGSWQREVCVWSVEGPVGEGECRPRCGALPDVGMAGGHVRVWLGGFVGMCGMCVWLVAKLVCQGGAVAMCG